MKWFFIWACLFSRANRVSLSWYMCTVAMLNIQIVKHIYWTMCISSPLNVHKLWINLSKITMPKHESSTSNQVTTDSCRVCMWEVQSLWKNSVPYLPGYPHSSLGPKCLILNPHWDHMEYTQTQSSIHLSWQHIKDIE